MTIDVLRNDSRIHVHVPISMILVSFFSEDNVLSDEIKICYTFEYQSNENRAFHIFWDTQYSSHNVSFLKYSSVCTQCIAVSL